MSDWKNDAIERVDHVLAMTPANVPWRERLSAIVDAVAWTEPLVVNDDPARHSEVESAIARMQADKSTRTMVLVDGREDRALVREVQRAKTLAMRAITVGLEICRDVADEVALRALADQLDMPAPRRAMTMYAIMRASDGIADARAQPGDLVLVEVPPNCTVHEAQAVDLARLIGAARRLGDLWRSSNTERDGDPGDIAEVCQEIADLTGP